MRILAIETSCDETGFALIDGTGGLAAPKIKIKKEVLTSQIAVHAPWGGVVPSLAKREHIKNLPILYRQIFGVAGSEKRKWKEIDAIAVTVGPGLEPALWAGIEFAKDLAKAHKKPLLGANHMEGHLYSPLLEGSAKPKFPAVALIVSGGHTMLLRLESFGKWKKLGETRDDAAGEAFDKVARLLNLPYPGGPEISKLALKGNPQAIDFPRPMLHSKDYDFSFSGLKTAVLYYLREHGYKYGTIAESSREHVKKIPPKLLRDIAASFERAAVDVLAQKTFRAVKECGAKSAWLAGGVAANPQLRKNFEAHAKALKIPLILPDMAHNTDNAAMIGAAAYLEHLRKRKLPIHANGSMNI